MGSKCHRAIDPPESVDQPANHDRGPAVEAGFVYHSLPAAKRFVPESAPAGARSRFLPDREPTARACRHLGRIASADAVASTAFLRLNTRLAPREDGRTTPIVRLSRRSRCAISRVRLKRPHFALTDPNETRRQGPRLHGGECSGTPDEPKRLDRRRPVSLSAVAKSTSHIGAFGRRAGPHHARRTAFHEVRRPCLSVGRKKRCSGVTRNVWRPISDDCDNRTSRAVPYRARSGGRSRRQ